MTPEMTAQQALIEAGKARDAALAETRAILEVLGRALQENEWVAGSWWVRWDDLTEDQRQGWRKYARDLVLGKRK